MFEFFYIFQNCTTYLKYNERYTTIQDNGAALTTQCGSVHAFTNVAGG